MASEPWVPQQLLNAQIFHGHPSRCWLPRCRDFTGNHVFGTTAALLGHPWNPGLPLAPEPRITHGDSLLWLLVFPREAQSCLSVGLPALWVFPTHRRSRVATGTTCHVPASAMGPREASPAAALETTRRRPGPDSSPYVEDKQLVDITAELPR